jgi:hypothetical protein
MLNIAPIAGGLALIAALALPEAASAQCSAPSVYISRARSEAEGPMTVRAGTGCRFNVNGIPGAIDEVKIIQAPKVGRAGVQNLEPFYMAKPGYTGPDEFAYAFIGTDQYGGPMNVVIRRKITVVP